GLGYNFAERVGADLALSKTVNDTRPPVGSVITYTITLVNHGPHWATGVQVTDALPAGLAFVSASPGPGSYNSAANGLTAGYGANGGVLTLALSARVTGANPSTNTAFISAADQYDQDPGNNSGSASITPQGADLAVTNTVSNPRPNVGDLITYTVVLTDYGP